MVPWRDDAGRRSELWKFCRTYWEHHCPEIPIVEGTSPDGPFNRSAAINDAARGSWDVGIVLDADVIAPADQIHAGIARATETGRLTLPFTRFVGLSMRATQVVLTGKLPRDERGARFLTNHHESSIVIVPRKLWDELGSFDERFVGWGQEDVAFCHASRVIGGDIERIPGYVWHLEHATRSERGRGTPQYEANQALGRRYRVIRDPEQMRALVREGR